ncbi:MAG TPA: hypothetical protein VF503_28135 [Sphingobium sp.]|uniref:hypothetical protein n=1 Tax=Sphingobium sp. TaxID=1912891 RepID=UPI002ED3CEFC
MSDGKVEPLISAAAGKLREIILARPDGELLGSEDDIVALLNVSRVTTRQTARLLEQEGLLRVKRGKNGGYFASRPTSEMIEATVCNYLNTLKLGTHHTGKIAEALWVETLRRAAEIKSDESRKMAEALTVQIHDLDPEAGLRELVAVEQRIRSDIFRLIDGAYIDLIFRINAAYARQHHGRTTQTLEPERHRLFVQQWKQAKLSQMDAIIEGDVFQAVAAALHERSLWLGRGRLPL